MQKIVRVAGMSVEAKVLRGELTAFAASNREMLQYYDFAVDGPVLPAQDIDVELIGRLHFLRAAPTPEASACLIEFEIGSALAALPEAATLAVADPNEENGLFDVAERVHRLLLAASSRLNTVVVSATLALLRPALFPILSTPIRILYDDLAERDRRDSRRRTRTFSQRSYWSVIRADLLEAGDQIATWRGSLASSEVESERWMANLTDVRLWGIAVLPLCGPR